MADFIAVIRRAVNGLANNTPEMRAKVYDKARSAVLRQLENMSPRPPEEMIRRQMDKLTAAIEEVEAEHAAALPALEEQSTVFDSDVEAVAATPPEAEPETVVPEHRPEPAKADQRDDYASARAAPDLHHEAVEPQERRDVYSSSGFMPEPRVEVEPEAVQPLERPLFDQPVHEPPAFRSADDWTVDRFARQSDEQSAKAVEPESFEPPASPAATEPAPSFFETPDYQSQADDQPDLIGEAKPSYASRSDIDDLLQDSPLTSRFNDEPRYEPVAPEETPVAEAMPVSRRDTDSAYDAWTSFPLSDQDSASAKEPGADIDWPEDRSRDAGAMQDDFDTFVNSGKGSAGPAMPGAIDLLDWHNELASLPPLSGAQAPAQPAATAFSQALPASVPEKPALPPAAKPTLPPIPAARVDNFDDLLGDTLPPASKNGAAEPTDIDDFLAAAQQTAYRQEAKPRRNFVPLVLGLAGLIVLAGGGYAAWVNRTVMSDFFSGLVSSVPEIMPGDSNGTATNNAGQLAASGTDPATTTPTETAASTPAAPQEGETVGQKFTQRLNADGTEVDEGAAGANGATGEGRSVAQQTVAPSDQPGPTPSAPGGAQTTTTPAETSPPAATANAALPGAQERAFLYEERLGQVSPTAIVGTVEWTALRQSGPDGRPDPAIQGKLNIAERGLNALITFRRNNDNSLPASHLVEIVFSMPADFEGGAIDAVQRVAMKRTEQDRGDPLVGVAAKVTDDTFLIALNDFPDVVAANMDLMQTRNWIDIPITYRNGRRALLTLDKGTNGGALFAQVIKEWIALGGRTGG